MTNITTKIGINPIVDFIKVYSIVIDVPIMPITTYHITIGPDKFTISIGSPILYWSGIDLTIWILYGLSPIFVQLLMETNKFNNASHNVVFFWVTHYREK